MERPELIQAVEDCLLTVASADNLSSNERYVAAERLSDVKGYFSYVVLGSLGARVIVSCDAPLPEEPFLIMRRNPKRRESTWVYQAIALSTLEDLSAKVSDRARPERRNGRP